MKTFLHYLWRGLLVVLCGVFLGVFIFAAYQLYTTFHGYHEATKEYNELNEQYVSAPAETSTPEAEEEVPLEPLTGPITVNFDELKERNSDIAGWIYGPDTPISYPVVKGSDNEFYLYHNFDGGLNQSGTIFMDMVCEKDLSQDNTILYGHHMNNGGMFATIENYKQEDYFKDHPVLYYYTPDEIYVLQVFSTFVTGGDSDVYAFNFATPEDYEEFIERMRSRANHPTDIEVTSEDHIMTLSTCAYDYDDARYVVLCKIVPLNDARSILQPEETGNPQLTEKPQEAETENNAQQGEIITA